MNEEQRRDASHLMKLVHHLRFHRLRMLHSEEGIFPGQPPVLFRLRRQVEMSQRELAAALDQTPASMTVTLRRMEKAGLIERNMDPADKRVQKVRLTQKGLDVCGIAQSAESVVDEENFVGFSDEEVHTLIGLMARCAENMSRVTGRPQKGERLYEEYLRHVGRSPDAKEGETKPD